MDGEPSPSAVSFATSGACSDEPGRGTWPGTRFSCLRVSGPKSMLANAAGHAERCSRSLEYCCTCRAM